MAKKTQAQLYDAISDQTGLSKSDVDRVFGAFAAVVGTELADGNSLPMPGIGTLKPTMRRARKGRNPQTGETIDIAASNSATLSLSRPFKQALN